MCHRAISSVLPNILDREMSFPLSRLTDRCSRLGEPNRAGNSHPNRKMVQTCVIVQSHRFGLNLPTETPYAFNGVLRPCFPGVPTQLTLYPPSSWPFSLDTCFSDEASVPDFLVAIRLRTLNLFTEAEVSMSTTADDVTTAGDESEPEAALSCCSCSLLTVGRLSLLRMAGKNKNKFL